MGDLRRLIVFDLDGTLVDSERDLADSANQLLVELGADPLPESAIGAMVGDGAAMLVRRALDAAGIGHPQEALPRFLEIYDRRLLQHTRAYDGIVDVVRRARRSARLAVLTNKPSGPSERLLSALGLRDDFDAVVGGDGPWPRKPDPAGLLDLVATAHASPGTTLFVGDSHVDHETAVRAGVRYCLAAYGFGYDNFPAERLDRVEWLARTPGQLGGIIERFTAGV